MSNLRPQYLFHRSLVCETCHTSSTKRHTQIKRPHPSPSPGSSPLLLISDKYLRKTCPHLRGASKSEKKPFPETTRVIKTGRRERTGLRAQVALERRERDERRARRLRIQDVLAVQLRRSYRSFPVLGRFHRFRTVVGSYFFLRRRVIFRLAEVAKIKLAHGLRQRAPRRRDEGGCARQR